MNKILFGFGLFWRRREVTSRLAVAAEVKYCAAAANLKFRNLSNKTDSANVAVVVEQKISADSANVSPFPPLLAMRISVSCWQDWRGWRRWQTKFFRRFRQWAVQKEHFSLSAPQHFSKSKDKSIFNAIGGAK